MTLNRVAHEKRSPLRLLLMISAMLIAVLMAGTAVFADTTSSEESSASATPAPAAVPAESDSYYVYDGPDVLSSDTESTIVEKNKQLNSDYGAAIVIMAVDTLNGSDIETFAQDVFQSWKIGGDSHTGVLLVMDINEDSYFAVSGTGFGDEFSSTTLKSILDENTESSFAAKKYDDAALGFFNTVVTQAESYLPTAVISTASEESSVNSSVSGSESSVAGSESSESSAESSAAPASSGGGIGAFFGTLFKVILVLVIIVVVIFIVSYIHGQMVRKKRRRERMARRRAARNTSRTSAPRSGTSPQRRSSSIDKDYQDFMDRYK